MSKHSDLSVGEIHPMFNWLWPENATRLTQPVTADDVNKVGLVEDTDAIYILKDITPTWVAIAGSVVVNIDDLGDVTITTPTLGEVLTYDGTNWINDTGSAVLALNDLSDVTLSGVVDDEVLTFSGGTWVNNTIPASAINDLSDVVISTPSSGQTLEYNGANWINTTPSASSSHIVSDAVTNTVSSAVTLGHNTSGAVSDGFGVGISLQAETDTTENQPIGAIELTYTDSTDAVRDSKMVFKTVVDGSLAEVGVLSGGAGTTPIGNTRGENAVDLQSHRTASTQVASGIGSINMGGIDNTSAGDFSSTGGVGNINNGEHGFIPNGYGNLLGNSPRSSIINGSGNSNTAGDNHLIGGGYGNEITSTGTGCTILNGDYSQITENSYVTVMGQEGLGTRHGEIVQASGQFGDVGDAQKSSMIARYEGSVPDNIGKVLKLNGADEYINIRDSVSFTFHILVNGTISGTMERYSYMIEGSGYGPGGSNVVVDYQLVTPMYESTGNYIVEIKTPTADSLNIQVRRPSGTSTTIMRWVAHITLIEVLFV